SGVRRNLRSFPTRRASDLVTPSNAEAVNAAAANDRQVQQGIDFDAWAAAGITYVLRGVANGASGQAELYDVASRQRVFGKQYQRSEEHTSELQSRENLVCR